MTALQRLIAAWSWDPSVVLGSLFLVGGYLAVIRPLDTKKAMLFGSGVLALFLALESPLEKLGDTYLFSAHMAQHLLLILIVPPLLLLGLPGDMARQVLAGPLAGRIERMLRRPPVAWLLGTAAVWIWHLPALYNAALADENIHIVEHLFFLVAATIFWWPVLTPLEDRRLAPLATIPYLFAAAVASSALGIILTFAPPGLYPAYLHPTDPLGLLPLLRQDWGLSPVVDQQLGGLLMWVPGSLVYLSGIIGAMGRWYSEAEEKGNEQEAWPKFHKSELHP